MNHAVFGRAVVLAAVWLGAGCGTSSPTAAKTDAGAADADAAPACTPAKCDDGSPCTDDSCDAAGVCVHSAHDGIACDDHNACTSGDSCSATVCSGVPVVCNDGSVCTTDSCDPASGCVFEAHDGVSCLTTDYCTKFSTCSNKLCVGVPVDCKDDNVCTDDGCDPASGCVHLPNAATCLVAENPCTVDDFCALGACQKGKPKACDDGNPCTTDYCSNLSCAAYVSYGVACDLDGNPCTEDRCLGSLECSAVPGSALPCDDLNGCTADSCDPKLGCTHVPLAGGATCADDGCTTGGSCDAGVCKGQVPKVCAAGLQCGAGSCAPPGMVLIPGGTFWMGCEQVPGALCDATGTPMHKVTLSAYYLDRDEVTVAQYKACVDAGVCADPGPNPWQALPAMANRPIVDIPWDQARGFCKWRGADYDLPTEAQWEMAARGDCTTNGSTADDPTCKAAMRAYPWGETAPSCSYAVMSDLGKFGCGTGAPLAVGSKPAGDSPYGLHDMAGNAAEWTLDWFSFNYNAFTAPQIDPVGAASGSSHTARGGDFAGNSYQLRTTYRMGTGGMVVGIRCRKTAP